MTVLRFYGMAECDAQGVPLDWERCRTCEGAGRVPDNLRPDACYGCPVCDGHGSLKAAALAEADHSPSLPDGSKRHRCVGCGHPMSDGTWELIPGLIEGRGVELTPTMGMALHDLRAGQEPTPMPAWPHVHWSPCDEGCRHGLPARWAEPDDLVVEPDPTIFEEAWDDVPGTDERVSALLSAGPIEASWRPVDVRPLDWPHDLRPESLAVLCLRCWAARP